MGKCKKSTITKDQLLSSGWIESEQLSPILMVKYLVGEDKEDPEGKSIALILHRYMNTPIFALSLPDGSMVHINPASIEELNLFENLIHSYEPNY